MTKKYFIPRQELEKLGWLQNFANKLGGYAAKYGLTVGEVADMVAAAIFYAFWANYINQYNEYNKKLIQYRNELRDGLPDGATASVAPTPPVLGVVPSAVPPGIFKRAASIAAIIKNRTAYTEADGLDLGIEGSEAAKANLLDAKPSISLRLVQGGKPEVVWAKAGFDGIDIYVDRGNGSWVFLATDTYPNYIDNAPLPAGGTAAVWKYKAIYKYDDEVAGDWSDVVSITVGS
jgi:hypothetical protein